MDFIVRRNLPSLFSQTEKTYTATTGRSYDKTDVRWDMTAGQRYTLRVKCLEAAVGLLPYGQGDGICVYCYVMYNNSTSNANFYVARSASGYVAATKNGWAGSFNIRIEDGAMLITFTPPTTGNYTLRLDYNYCAPTVSKVHFTELACVEGDGFTYNLVGKSPARAVRSATHKQALLGEDMVTIEVESAEPLALGIGDVFSLIGTDYVLNQLPTVKRNGYRSYSTTIVFEGLQYGLIDKLFFPPEELGVRGSNLCFSLRTMVGYILASANRGRTMPYVLGDCPETTEAKNIDFPDANCLRALQECCQQWGVEFRLTQISDSIIVDIADTIGDVFSAATFEYGRHGGLYEVQRQKPSTDIITRLYAFGGSNNLNYYRHTRLCLPGKTRWQSYVEDASAIAAYGLREGVKNFEDVFPQFTGRVTSVGAYNEFASTDINFDLNAKWLSSDYAEWLALKGLEDTEEHRNIFNNDLANKATKYLVDGSTAVIHFQTGALAGYDIEIGSYNNSTHNVTLNPLVDENQYEFPSKDNSTFRIKVGDEFIILGINLPQEWKDEAERKLQDEAEAYYRDACKVQARYTISIEPMWLREKMGKPSGDTTVFRVGDLVQIRDNETAFEGAIRINDLERDLLDPYSYRLTLSDAVEVRTINRVVGELQKLSEVVRMNDLSDPNTRRRSWNVKREVLDMVFDTEGDYYTDKIKPQSIETQMLAVGARSQQFTLANFVLETNVPNSSGTPQPNVCRWSAGQLYHYTIAEPDIRVWNIASSAVTLSGDGAVYIYARCERNSDNAVLILDNIARVFDAEQGYYYFLLGTLSSVQDGARVASMTYGFSTINGRFITTGRISSTDGSTYFDLDSGKIAGHITFTAPKDSDNYKLINTLIGGNSAVTGAASSAASALTAAGLAQTTADAAKSAAEDTQKALDSLSVGGRNLVQGTATAITSPSYTMPLTKTIPRGAKATISFDYEISNGGVDILIAPHKWWLGGYEQIRLLASESTSGRIERTFTASRDVEAIFFLNGDSWGVIERLVVSHLKIELGTMATDWTPAPEDVSAEIAEAYDKAEAATNSLTSLSQSLTNLESQVDGKVEMWFYKIDPSTSNVPASMWTTDAMKKAHEGDLYYNPNSKGYWEWNGSAWVHNSGGTTETDAKLNALKSAYANASNATADGKAQVFASQPTPPYEKGDMWLQGSSGDILYSTVDRATGSFVASDWVSASKYTDDTAANLAMTAAEEAAALASKYAQDSDNLFPDQYIIRGGWGWRASGDAPENVKGKYYEFNWRDVVHGYEIPLIAGHTYQIELSLRPKSTADKRMRPKVSLWWNVSGQGWYGVGGWTTEDLGPQTTNALGLEWHRYRVKGIVPIDGATTGKVYLQMDLWENFPTWQVANIVVRDETIAKNANDLAYLASALQKATEGETEITGGLLLTTLMGVRQNGEIVAGMNGADTDNLPMIFSGRSVDLSNGTFQVWKDGRVVSTDGAGNVVTWNKDTITFGVAGNDRNVITSETAPSSGITGANGFLATASGGTSSVAIVKGAYTNSQSSINVTDIEITLPYKTTTYTLIANADEKGTISIPAFSFAVEAHLQTTGDAGNAGDNCQNLAYCNVDVRIDGGTITSGQKSVSVQASAVRETIGGESDNKKLTFPAATISFAKGATVTLSVTERGEAYVHNLDYNDFATAYVQVYSGAINVTASVVLDKYRNTMYADGFIYASASDKYFGVDPYARDGSVMAMRNGRHAVRMTDQGLRLAHNADSGKFAGAMVNLLKAEIPFKNNEYSCNKTLDPYGLSISASRTGTGDVTLTIRGLPSDLDNNGFVPIARCFLKPGAISETDTSGATNYIKANVGYVGYTSSTGTLSVRVRLADDDSANDSGFIINILYGA